MRSRAVSPAGPGSRCVASMPSFGEPTDGAALSALRCRGFEPLSRKAAMTTRRRRTSLIWACAWALATAASAAQLDKPRAPVVADLVLLNGRILTVDEKDTIAEALAVKDGRILAVGATREIEPLVGPKTERIDLQGRAATPGLLDAHCHFAAGAIVVRHVIDLSYPAVKGVDDVVRKFRDKVGVTKAGDWVIGAG